MAKIKKRFKIFTVSLLILLCIPLTALILLQNNRVQLRIVNMGIEKLSESLNTNIHVGSVNISLLNKISLNDVYLEDLNQDTLLFAENIKLKVKDYKFNDAEKWIHFSFVDINKADIQFRIDQKSEINIRFIIKALKKNTPEHDSIPRLKLIADDFNILNSKYSIKKADLADSLKRGINFADLQLRKLNLETENFYLHRDTVNLYIDQMSFLDKSGFRLDEFSANLSISQKYMKYSNVEIRTPHTELTAQKINTLFRSFKDFTPDYFRDHVKLDIAIKSGHFAYHDLAYFAPYFNNFTGKSTIKGNVYGYIKNLKGKNFQLSYLNSTNIHLDFSLSGLPDFKQTFIYANFDKLQTTPGEIAQIYEFVSEDTFPKSSFKDLTHISFNGKFTGFPDDFVTYGTFNTNLGAIKTDLLLKPGKDRPVLFSGKTRANNFKLGQIMDASPDMLSRLSFNLSMNGSISRDKQFDASIKGNISKVEINQYPYSNIKFEGQLYNDNFDGSVVVSDPNLEMEFNGLVDFSEEVNQMNFTANVLHANLFKLNIDKSDPSSFATFILKANGKGSGIDNLNGEINVLNSFFYKNEKQIQLYDLSLNVHNTPEKDLIRLTSDAVDVNIEGKYKIKTLKKSLFALLYKYFPSFNKAENVTDIFAKNENDFSFEVMLKNTSEFTSFFIPELKINNQTSLYGRYAPSKNHITLHAEASGLSFKKNKWKNFYINLTGDTTDFAIESGSSTLTYLEDLDLENFTFFIAGINDSLNVKARWNNWDTTTYKGLIESNFIFSERKNKRPAIKAELLPSKVIMRDSVWNISLNSLTIDSSMIDINDLSVNQKKESFTINGRISKNPSDQLKITFNDFDLGGSDVIFPKEKVKFEGIVNGETTIKDFYNNLTLTSDLEINTFSFNHQLFGNTDLVANWSNLNKKVNIEAISKIKDIETFHLSGDYKPSTKNMDFYLLFDKIDLGIIEPFLSGVFSDITGLTSGELFVSGFINKPLVNGTLNLRKSGLTVDYLKTRYTFNDQVKLVNNNFYFEEITLNDSKGSTAVLNGSISNAFFRDFNLNINIFPENFLMLNTSLSNNEDFYGNANVSGKVGIYGPLDNINFNITVSTNKGTQMYIPLSTGIEEVASYNFIKIKSPDQQESLLVKDYPENLSGIQMNFDLDITPDAEVQMIFDSKVGDIIRARGEGNLILEVDTKGKFTMFGDYTISEGEYLFTMQNIVNKRFKIKKGGLISWNGDPLDANIDLTAVYPTKASPENLFIGEEAELYSKRIPVECELRLTDDLTDPDIFFDILLPSTDQELRAKVKSKLNTEEELTKQFISLLVFNNFMIDSPQKQFASTGQSSGANLGKVTTFEMLSNQFSHYLSQWSKDFDIGVYYRPEDEVSQQEFEVELSTKVLNDRVSINTNLEIGGDEYDIERPGTTSDGDITQTSNIVGEFEIDVQIDKAGKWHFKAFNRANDYYAYRSSEYTQGVSLEFKENFNSFNELVRNFFGENKKDK